MQCRDAVRICHSALCNPLAQAMNLDNETPPDVRSCHLRPCMQFCPATRRKFRRLRSRILFHLSWLCALCYAAVYCQCYDFGTQL